MLFDAFKATLNVEDHPRSAGSLRFSWYNNRAGVERALARLDRLYLFQSTARASKRKLLHYCIKGDLTRSDHHPVVVSLQLEDQPAKATIGK